ncbi:MAG: hypothetical protein F6K00_10940 [Leptolyngbya sp. SIOISBB]|nr:hypothetical protein [Leptolyngbya sp. SIOISBB]
MAKQSDNNRMITNQDGPSVVAHKDQAVKPTSLELAQIYALIDSILPFEACLYYQVAPLYIDGSCLIMGTVDPDDPAATEYVTRQLSYINYSIRFQKIASEWHRDLLSQYLKHTAEEKQASSSSSTATPTATAEANATPASASAVAAAETAERTDQPVSNAGAAITDEQLQATLILEQIEEMTATMPRDFTSHLVAEEQEYALEDEASPAIALEAVPASPPAPEPIAENRPESPPAQSEDDHESLSPTPQAASVATPLPAPPVPTPPPQSVISEPAAAAIEAPPVSRPATTPDEIEAPPVSRPATTPEEVAPAASVPTSSESPTAPVDDSDDDISRLLCALPPKVLMQALLDKIIGDGIGRLYLKEQASSNRILWSRNGVLEGLIEPVESQVLQAVINEFKQLTHVAMTPVTQPKQVEIERTQNGQRILLRLKIIPGTDTEQATLQVLRGAALAFHQQQQMDRLGRRAMDAAQMLQHRLNILRDSARKSLDFPPTRSKTLTALVKLLKELDIQVQEIEAAYNAHEEESDN